MDCRICNGMSYLFFKYLDFFGKSVSIYKCIDCGHGSHDLVYSSEDFDVLYQNEYASSYIKSGEESFAKRQIQYKNDIESLTKKISHSNALAVLDYGCSSGNFLDLMPSSWKKYGYEVNPAHIEYCKNNKPDIKIFEEINKIEGNFDIVTMRGVIEHIQDHNDLLDFLNKRIIIGGGLFISATPNFASFSSSFYKKDWNQIKCPEHIHQFTLTSLSYLLAKAGLVLKHAEYPYYETPYADWHNDKINFLKNIRNQQSLQNGAIAFPGNMITAFFEKIDVF